MSIHTLHTPTYHYEAFDIALERAHQSLAAGEHDKVKQYLASAYIQAEKIMEMNEGVARDNEGMMDEGVS